MMLVHKSKFIESWGHKEQLTSYCLCFTERPEVVSVTPDSLYKLQTTRSWDYLGLSPQTPNNILDKTNMGDGIIIGVLDTGDIKAIYIPL